MTSFKAIFNQLRLPLDKNSLPASALIVFDGPNERFLPGGFVRQDDNSVALKINSTVENAELITPVAIGAAATLILASSARLGQKLTNRGPSSVFVGFDNTVLNTNGIEVASGAEFPTGLFEQYTGDIWGITTGNAIVR